MPLVGAFLELGTERQIGMQVGPIPVSRINGYIQDYNLPDWWAAVIAQVDAHMLAKYNAMEETA